MKFYSPRAEFFVLFLSQIFPWENSIFLWSMEFQLFIIAELSQLITLSSDGIMMPKCFACHQSPEAMIARANMNLAQKKDEWTGNAEAHMGVFPQGGSLQAVERWTDCSLGGGRRLLSPLPFQVFKVKGQSQFGFTRIVL